MGSPLDIVVVTNFGLEAVAARELAALGYEGKGASTGRVVFQGDERAVARANLWLRTADRVLVRLELFECHDFDVLFETVREFAWEEWIPPDFAFPVDGRSVRSKLSSVPALQRTVKKAIVERLMRAHGVRVLPETGPTVRVEVSMLHDTAIITVDTSGAGLHKRGYRPVVGEAALKETLAAGLVQLSVWKPDRPLIDPFCGTGTIAIEAATRARNIAPGLKREFDAEKWPRIGEQVWREAREEALAAPRGELGYTIHASDSDERALSIARQAAAAAGVERDIHFKLAPFEELSSKAEFGCVVTNPPYGVRLGDESEIDRLYRSMPGVFRRLPTWSFHILTGRLDLENIFGQKATRRRKFYNAQIECWYFTFLGPRRQRERKTRRDYAIERGEDTSFLDAAEAAGADAPGGGSVEQASIDPDAIDPTSRPPVFGAEPGPTRAGALSSPPDSPSVASSALPRRSPREISSSAFGGLRERDEKELGEFASRLKKNAQHLRRYASRGITCYRVYERDCPDVPLIVDRYEDHAHIAEYEREHARTLAQQADWWDRVRAIVAGALAIPVEHVHSKEKRRQRGLTQHEKQGESGETMTVQEGGLRFEVNLRDYIDTGLFLDHRLTRARVREEARGKRFLNLFCYTGSFTVYAAAGGAASTTSVDLSNTYIDWAQRNMRLNGHGAGAHKYVRGDVLEFLRSHAPGEWYDLAVVDPPTFSNSKSTEEDWEVAHGHAELLRLLVPLMARPRSAGAAASGGGGGGEHRGASGVIYFSTNYRRFKLDEELLGELGVAHREISNQTVPPEYRNERIHRCWRMVVG